MNPANFDSNALDAVQWQDGYLRRQCSASADGVYSTVQLNLIDAAEKNGGRIGSWDPSSIDGYGGGWNRNLLAGLAAFLQRYRAPASLVSAVTRDMSLPVGSRLSTDTVRAAIWTETSRGLANGVETYGVGSPSEIMFASGSVTPRYGSRSPVPSNGLTGQTGFNCRQLPAGAGSGTGAFSAVGRFLISPLGLLTLASAAAVAMALSTDKARKQLSGARKNPSRGSMTFGVIPSASDLRRAIEAAGGWSMTLRGSDERSFDEAMQKARIRNAESIMQTGKGMRRVLSALMRHGDENAQSLASSIVYVLGWEWI